MIPDQIQPNLSDLADYLAWSNNGHDSLTLYATFTTAPDTIIGMARFFFPEFEMYREGIFRKGEYSEFAVDHWYDRLEGDWQAVEKMVNFRHLSDIFQDQCANWSPTTIAFLGNVIRHTWAAALAATFPDRRFAVTAEREDEQSDDVVVTFWQVAGR